MLIVDSEDGVADYVGGGSSVCDEVGDEIFNSKKSKIMLVGKRKGGTSWKISRETMEEVVEFRYLVCGLKGNYEVLSI